MGRICRDLAEESRVPGEAGALLEMAENYGREAARITVVRTADCSRRRRKMRAISARLTGHPFRQSPSADDGTGVPRWVVRRVALVHLQPARRRFTPMGLSSCPIGSHAVTNMCLRNGT